MEAHDKTVMMKKKAAILSFFVVFAELFGFAGSAYGTDGVPKIISYQGRLADSAGTLLGGSSGTTFYFKFSISDDPISDPETSTKV